MAVEADALEFSSSDSQRSAAPLRHARLMVLEGPLALELGGELAQVEVQYETYGTLSPQADNAVLICHALSGDSHVARHTEDDTPGWWDILVGPGKWIDTNRYFVVCQNVLGGCRGTTGPNSTNPRTGRPYGADFPAVTVGDMVEVQRRVLDHLGIDQLCAVIGGSLGGQQALAWATSLPQRVRGCIALATSARLTSQAVAFDVVGRNAILHDPGYRRGQYYEHGNGPNVGLALARMLAHITYLSRDAMTAKFDPSRLKPRDIATAFEKKFSVGSYLAYQGHKFVERFDANSYVTLSMAMDLFDLGGTAAELQTLMGRSQCQWLVLSFSSDWLFPPQQSKAIVHALAASDRDVSYCNIETQGGHDSFLLEEKLEIYGGMIGGFLANLCSNREWGIQLPDRAPEPTSIFHGERLDYEEIVALIPRGASVLDLGSGDGGLMAQLREQGHQRLVGIELDEDAILRCVQRGLHVIQHNLEDGLALFSDGQFDLVILSQTLQSVTRTEHILSEMVRVGRRAIASFPNFAYHKLRSMLYRTGRSPKSEGPYKFEWWNSPNRRFPSILDFEELCATKGIRIERRVYLDTETNTLVTEDPNWNADVAIFVLAADTSRDTALHKTQD